MACQRYAGNGIMKHMSREKKTEKKGKRKWKWPLVWLVQIVEMLIISALVALTDAFGGIIYNILAWAAMPILGLLSSCRATRRGLLNYAAWIAPPICMALTHWLIWTYLPDAAPVLICAFCSLVGAAAGEVLNQQEKQAKKKRKDEG